MLREAENRVKIEGILAEVNIEPTTFNKNGQQVEALRGTITVNVTQKICGEEKDLAIPVHMFAPKLTNAGRPNPAYESIKRVKNEFTSIAAAGGVEGADRIRITGAKITMNEYYGGDGRLISFPRITSSFFNKVSEGDFKPEATFSVEFVVAKKGDEIGRNGEPTGRYRIDAILPQYGGKVDVIPFYAQSEGVISAVSTYWEVGDTVRANGRLNFSSKSEITLEEVDFGEPIEKVKTINVSDLIITGGSQEPVDEEFAFDAGEIQTALADRKARLEGQKNRDMSRTTTKAAPPKKSGHGFDDLGF